MSKYYTSVSVIGSNIYLREIEDGKRSNRKIEYHPSLFLPASGDSKYRTIDGKPVDKINPGTIRDCRAFVNQYKGIDGYTIYGNQRYEYNFIMENYAGQIDWDFNQIRIGFMDIEVETDGGYATPEDPYQPLQSVGIKVKDTMYLIGMKDYETQNENEVYIKVADEIALLEEFYRLWQKLDLDVITGWYIKHFDIPYIINRTIRILGESAAKRISPWRSYYSKVTSIMNRDVVSYVIQGIATLDYMDLYKKFAAGGAQQESYSLNHIASVELDETKIDYGEYENLGRLYKENPQLFYVYNIQDVELITRLDSKLNLLELALTLAYDAKVNYEDVFMQVRMWDSIIMNKLWEKNIVIPPMRGMAKVDYAGGFVKEPHIGIHEWLASFDLDGLYPHLIMQYNMGPDTVIDSSQYTADMRRILSQGVNVENLLHERINMGSVLTDNKVTLTASGQYFDVSKKSFLAEIMADMYADRSQFKKLMIKYQKQLEKETDKGEIDRLKKLISRYNNLQLSKKVCLNSAYGTMGNNYFRYYDPRIAEAITLSGQLSIRWVSDRINAFLNRVVGTENIDRIVANDTDSCYIRLDDIVKKYIKDTDKREIIRKLDRICEDQIQPVINKSYDKLAKYLNAYEQKMHMKRESLCDRGVWTGKKRYILNVYNNEGVEYAEPKIKITGMEAIRSSTPTACRTKIKEAYSIIINGTEDEMIKFIADFKKEFRKIPIESIAFPRSANELEKYSDRENIYGKGTPIQVKGALIYNHFIKTNGLENKYELIKSGEKIKFLYLKMPNELRSTVVSFMNEPPKELDLSKWIDYNTQFEKAFLMPIKAILDVIGWKTEKTVTLEDFFT